MRRFLHIAMRLAVLASLALPAYAFAQTSASAFTYATRYDEVHRVTGTIAPDPDGSGPLKFQAVRNSYDDAGRLIRVEKGELATWQDQSVKPVSWTGFTVFSKVETSYDVLDRKTLEAVSGWDSVALTWIVGSVTQYSYDASGRLECAAARMDSAKYATLPSSACALSAPAASTGSYGPDRITRNLYDAAGQVLTVQKAYGITTANGFSQTLQQDYVKYSYTNTGKQQSVTDANGNVAMMTYDGFDRQSRWHFPDKTALGAVSMVDYEAYGYDPNGNRTSLRKRDGRTLTYAYDALNRMTSKTIGACPGGSPPAGMAACVTVASSATRPVYYSYDLRGLQLSAVFDSASGTEGLSNGYDGFGRLASAGNTMGGNSRTLSYQWDADGNRTRVTHPDGNYFVYGYDGLDRMVALSENSATAPVATIAYNAKGERSSATRDTVATSYTYDPVGRLSSLSDDLAGTASDVTSSFAYNPASQIVGRTRTNSLYAPQPRTTNQSYATNGLNQYASVSAAAFSYDANGNLTTDGGTSMSYDAENRLITSTLVSGALVYDPAGRLFQVGAKQFLYDGDELVGEYVASAPATVTKRYVHGLGDDDPWLWYGGSSVGAANRYLLQSDHQGSIVSVSTPSGVTINTYDEYGVPGTGNIGRFQYTGQAWLPEIGIYYYKARMYSPSLGRFMQTDPIGYEDQVNLYAYVRNDPIGGRDFSGMATGPSAWAELWDSIKSMSMLDWLAAVAEQPDEHTDSVEIQDMEDISHDAAIIQQTQKMVSRLSKTEKGASETVKSRADALWLRNGGKNSVHVVGDDMKMRVDLKGGSHYSKELGAKVPTPHFHLIKPNFIPSGPRAGEIGSWSEFGDPKPATHKELDLVDQLFLGVGL